MRYLLLFLALTSLSLAGCASKKNAEAQMEPEPLNEHAGIQYQFAYEFFQQGDLIRGLASALKAVEAAPRNPDARNLLGLIYFRQAEYEKSEAEFKMAIELNPKMSEAYNNIGTLYYEMKRYAEAKVALERALENPLYLYPERIYNNLGLVYEAMAKKADAQQAYERAIALRSDYYLPYLNLGEFWLKNMDHKRARPLLREAARLCPACSEPKYHLAQAMLAENRMEEALKLFKQGYDLDPKGYYGQLCRQFLVEHGSMKDE